MGARGTSVLESNRGRVVRGGVFQTLVTVGLIVAMGDGTGPLPILRGLAGGRRLRWQGEPEVSWGGPSARGVVRVR